ncbi:MAG: FecR domain-containing protein [Spirochaetales bacterium]|nr:FecR domain-containing protein [Leptospiraceae bacterium]MCP5483099.1 FecR domain-containing protein [Spirochaetales bacterium]MCP5484539.1 FecR domain-containing protein [Spirochaetales bacterium]
MQNPVGAVQVTRRDGEQYFFTEDMQGSADALLLEGMLLRTGPDGSVDLKFQTGIAMRVGASTGLRMTRSQIVSDDAQSRVLVDLVQGRLMTRTETLTADSEIVVRTPTAVASVRGTEFAVIEEELNQLLVNEGQVDVADETGTVEETVTEGNRAEVDPEGQVELTELSEEDQEVLDELSDGLEYLDPEGAAQIDSIIETYEDARTNMEESVQQQIQANREMFEQETQRMRNEFEQQREEIQGGVRDQLDRIRSGGQ